jgi:hypothetical protein
VQGSGSILPLRKFLTACMPLKRFLRNTSCRPFSSLKMWRERASLSRTQILLQGDMFDGRYLKIVWIRRCRKAWIKTVVNAFDKPAVWIVKCRVRLYCALSGKSDCCRGMMHASFNTNNVVPLESLRTIFSESDPDKADKSIKNNCGK